MQLQPRVSGTGYGYDFNGCLHISAGTDIASPSAPDPRRLRGQVPAHLLQRHQRRYRPHRLADPVRPRHLGHRPDLGDLDRLGRLRHRALRRADRDLQQRSQLLVIVATNTTNATTQICGVRVAYYAPLIFRDGFETGDTLRWSLTSP